MLTNFDSALAGYYSRVMALRHLLLQFLGRGKASSGPPLQVLSLGAGYDTTYFQLEVRANLCWGKPVLLGKAEPVQLCTAFVTARCNKVSA